jgi:hypothetical protein
LSRSNYHNMTRRFRRLSRRLTHANPALGLSFKLCVVCRRQVIALYKQAKDELRAANEQIEALRHGQGAANEGAAAPGGTDGEVTRLQESLRAKDDEIGNAQRRLDEERARVTSLQGQLAQANAANGSSGLEKQVADLQQEAERLRQSLASKQVGARCGPAHPAGWRANNPFVWSCAQAHIRQLQAAARAQQELEVVRAERDGLEKEARRLAKEVAREKDARHAPLCWAVSIGIRHTCMSSVFMAFYVANTNCSHGVCVLLCREKAVAAVQAKLDKERADHDKTREAVESQRGKATELSNAKARAERLAAEVHELKASRDEAKAWHAWHGPLPGAFHGAGCGGVAR